MLLVNLYPKLRKKDGSIITDKTYAMQETNSFFEELYSSKENMIADIDLKDLLSDKDVNKLTTNSQKVC